MSDDDLTPDALPPEDLAPDERGRDPKLAALLAVPPLDDLARRRMVDVALRERPRAVRPVGRAAAALGVAAALLIGVVVGAVVVTRPDDPQTTTAARAPEANDAATKDAAGAEAAAPELVPASDAANPLGDLGVLDTPGALRAAITARLEAGEALAASPAASTCLALTPDRFGLVTVTAVGTATLDARGQVVVLVGPTPEGDEAAVAVSPTECTVLERVPLGT
jgi:hypothetical protein